MSECPLCHGTKMIHTMSSFGMQVGPCPNCNENFKRRMKQEFEYEKRGTKYEQSEKVN